MRNYLKKLCPALSIMCLALAIIGCGAGISEVEDIAPLESIETTAALNNEIGDEAQATPTDLPAERVEPTPTLTSTVHAKDELAEPTPGETELPTELVEPEATGIPAASPNKEPTMSSGSSSRSVPIEGSEEAFAAAKADLAERLGVAPEAISLVSMEAVDWSDASLGCPQEGFMYAQVITPGYLMILEAEGQPYEYHTNQIDTVVLCEE